MTDSLMVYDDVGAEGYEILRRSSPAIVQEVSSALGFGLPNGPCKVLDAGCGSGNYLFEFAARPHLGLRLTGADISLQMLARAQRKTEGMGPSLLCCDLAGLPFGSESFDAAYMVHALHHVSGDPALSPKRRAARRQTVLCELRRVLATEGRLCIVLSAPWQNAANCLWNRYFPKALKRKLLLQPEPQDIAAQLHHEGFVDIDIRPFKDWLTRPVFQLQFVLQDKLLPIYSECSYLSAEELSTGRQLLLRDMQTGEHERQIQESLQRYEEGGGNVTAVSARLA